MAKGNTTMTDACAEAFIAKVKPAATRPNTLVMEGIITSDWQGVLRRYLEA